MNNKIVSTEKSIAIFLATVLVVGIIGITSPLAASAEAYQTAKCDSKNVYINDIEQIQQQERQTEANNFDTTANGQQQLISAEEEPLNALTGSNDNGNGNGEPLLNFEKNILNVCANFDNKNNPVVFGATQEQLPPTPCKVTVDTITGLGNQPIGIAYDPKHQTMYVSNGGFPSFSISIIDTKTNTVEGSPIKVGVEPRKLAYDNSQRMYVTNLASNTVSVIDTNTNTVVGNPIEVGDGPVDIAYDSINKRMYVTNFRDDTVSVIDTNTNTVVKSISTLGNEPSGIAFDEFHKRMYVANSDNKVSVIDTNTNTILDTPITVEGRSGSLAYDPIHHSMYVVSHDGFVSVIDTDTNAVVGSPIQIGNNPFEIAYDPINKRMMYVANNADGTVSVIDTNTNTVIDTITVGGGATGIAFDELHNRIYVTNGFDDTVSVINLC